MASRLCRACQDWHDLNEPWPAKCAGHFRVVEARSSLAFPMIKTDHMDAVMCMADGQMYDSKSRMSAVHRERGLIEVGNDIPAAMELAQKRPERPKVSKSEIGAAIDKVRQGYKPKAMTADAFNNFD
jgi:hypothetical protein